MEAIVDYIDYIRTESMILIPTLYIINLFLRQTPSMPVWLHPWCILFVGVISCMLYYGWMIESFVQGVLVSGVAVLIKDLIHKTLRKDQTLEDDDKE